MPALTAAFFYAMLSNQVSTVPVLTMLELEPESS